MAMPHSRRVPKVVFKASKMKRVRPRSLLLMTALFGLPVAATANAAGNNSEQLPESLRIQQQVENTYSKDRVVPIERQNAHHRNLGPSGQSVPPSDSGNLPDGGRRPPDATVEPGTPHQ
jgi:hypothetical protein